MFYLLLISISCNKAENIKDSEQETNITKPSAGFRSDEPKEKHIIHISWESGRERHGCSGFGMCDVEICGFCCTSNGAVVPCNESSSIINTGTIILDNTGVGIMNYELDESNTQESNAINNSSIFYIDEDLHIEGAVILKGEYEYNPLLGVNGGYVINILEK